MHEAGPRRRRGDREGGNSVRLGRARQLFLSAEPSSNVVGHTADLLLEMDEAQDVDAEKFDKELRPMAASTGATTVFYGTAWDDASLLERARQVAPSARTSRRRPAPLRVRLAGRGRAQPGLRALREAEDASGWARSTRCS